MATTAPVPPDQQTPQQESPVAPAAPASPTPAPAANATPSPTAGANGWKAAAGGAADATQSGPQAPAQPAPVATVPAPPVDAAPVYPKGMRGVLDRVVDSLAGQPTGKIRQGADGSVYIQHAPQRGQPGFSSGHQWLKIGAEAFSGAAAGLAAGKGAGNEGRALEAGVQAGQQMQQKQTEEQKQQLLELANISTLNHTMAANALELTRMQTEGSQHDIDWSEKQADRLTAQGATVAGHAGSLSDLTQFMRSTPQFNKDQAQKAMYTPVATYGPDGKANGFDIYKTLPGAGNEMLQPGQQVPFFNPVKGAIEYQKTASPMMQKDVNALWMAAGNAQMQYAKDKADINEKNAQAKKAGAGPQETPSATAEHQASTAKDWAEAHKAQADADAAAAKGAGSAALVDEIGTGKMAAGRMSYLLARNPDLMTAVAQKYPDFDSSKVEAYANTYKDFTEGKTAVQINSGATALGHMNELRKLNTPASHIPFTPAWTAYQNKVATLAPELAKFYGDVTIPAIEAIKKTLASTLPGNRDAAIKTQAQSMLDKFGSITQQWHNAAPSAVYEAAMPGVSPEAHQAAAELAQAYGSRVPFAQQQRNAAGGAGQFSAYSSDGKWGWNGSQWVGTGR